MLFWTVVLTLIIWILTSPFGIPWWFFLLALIALVVLIWWVVRQRREEEALRAARVQAAARGRVSEAAARAPSQPVPPSRPTPAPSAPQPTPAPAAPQPAPAPAAPKQPAGPDNLRRIEGIGPKIASILQAAGITTFAQLAETTPERLREILHEAGFRAPADPTTWPEQAKLAAAGDWDGLKALQDQLEGGRRT